MIAAMAIAASPASAEFTFGGFVNGEVERDEVEGNDPVTESIGRTNILAAYDTGNFRAGVGVDWDSDDESLQRQHFYALVGYGGFTATFGDIYGSGAFTGDEYWRMDDSTGKSDQTLRLDYQSPGFVSHGKDRNATGFSYALSVSYDYNGDDDDYELGAAARFGNSFLFTGYERDSEDLTVVFGQHHGALTYHVVAQDDLDDDDAAYTQFGGSIYYDVRENLTLGGNLLLDGDGNYHSFGVSALYMSESGVNVYAEWMDEDNDDVDRTAFEAGFLIPIGKTQPALYERMGPREYTRAHGF